MTSSTSIWDFFMAVKVKCKMCVSAYQSARGAWAGDERAAGVAATDAHAAGAGGAQHAIVH